MEDSLNSSFLPSWTLANNGNSPCNWTEIKCNEAGSNVEINLASSGLNGTLDRFDFSELHDNPFHGSIPSSIGNLKMLQSLNLANVGLNSSIPEELGFCTNLTFLELSLNSLTGSLPLSMSSLTRISEVGISANQLSREIHPYLLSNWSELKGEIHPYLLHHDCKPAIVHRDISRNNILLDTDFEPKISDFRTARLQREDESNWTAPVGSHVYIAPGMPILLTIPCLGPPFIKFPVKCQQAHACLCLHLSTRSCCRI